MANQLDSDWACASTRRFPPFSHRITWRASLAGRSAKDALRPGMSGKVIALFRRSFYVETARGDILCVASTTLAPGPLSLLCNFSENIDQCFPGLRQGDLARCSGNVLAIGDHRRVRLEATRTWRPRAIRLPVPVQVLACGLNALRKLRRDFTEGVAGSGQLVRAGQDCRSLAAVQMASDRPIADLREWLVFSLAHGAAARRPPNSARRLLGLGPGLTPSGDDFLGGVMLALVALGYRSLARPIEVHVLASARDRTNAISAAHLRCAARGEGSAAIHGLLAALCGQSMRSMSIWGRAVDQIGHSSGWDMVAGIEMTLRAVFEDSLKKQSPVVGGRPGN